MTAFTKHDIAHRDHYINKALAGNTVMTHYSLLNLWEMVARDIQGDIVEIGCYRGGSSLLLSATSARFNPASRVYLCDTFCGVVKSGPEDNHHKDGDFNDTSKEHVNSLLTEHELHNYSLLQGIFPDDTAHMIHSRSIGFIHIDVDTYKSYIDILNWCEGLLAPGAVLLFDDYHHASCAGAKMAVDEFFSNNPSFELHLHDKPFIAWARYTG